MNCKWCNKDLNGANDYQLLGYCNAGCRMKGGDCDKIDLVAEIDAAPNVVVVMKDPPAVVPKRKIKKPPAQDVIPKDFFAKSVLKDK